MVGRPVELSISRPKVEEKKSVLEVRDLNVVRADKTKALKNISFDMKSGEILGVVGIAGSGQKELCETLACLLYTSDCDMSPAVEGVQHAHGAGFFISGQGLDDGAYQHFDQPAADGVKCGSEKKPNIG